MAGVGESWEDLGYFDAVADQGSIQCLIDLGGGKVLMGIYGGFGPGAKSLIYHSTDYGENWTDLGRPINESYLYCFAHLGWGIIVAGTGTPDGKIIRSIDYGLTWTDEGQLAAENGVTSIVSIGGGAGLAGTNPNRNIYRTIDYGENWSGVCQLGGAGGKVGAMINIGNDIIIAGTNPDSEIFRSTDNGATWSLVGVGGFTEILCLAYLGNGIVLAGTNANPGEVLRSTDYGATWAVATTFPTISCQSLTNLENGIAVAGTAGPANGNIWRTADYGLTWTDLGRQYNANTINALIKLDDGRGMAGTGPAATYSKVLRSLAPTANGDAGGDIAFSTAKNKKPIILTHWVWKAKDGTTVDKYYSPIDTRCRSLSTFYDGRILSCSLVTRAIDDRTGLYSVSDMTIELANHDKEFSKMLARYFLKNQLVEIFHAWCDEPEAWKRSVFQGVVVDYSLKGTSFFVTIRDVTQKYFKMKVPPEVCT